MKVKALRAHNNGYGDKFEKAEGDIYEIPDEHAGVLIEQDLVAAVVEDAPPPGKQTSDKKG